MSARTFALAVVVWCAAAPCAAQGFGIGGRFAMLKNDVDAETDAQRFTGGQLRARISQRTGLELSLDLRTQTNETLTERVRDYPLQASLLLFPVKATFAPYILGGVGWYSHRVDLMDDGDVLESETTRKFGYHGGFGAELSLGRHAGLHADYRYTHLSFGDDDDEELEGAAEANGRHALSLLPSHKGSMWTAGLTIYF
jgi:opacity protein-like surface antigen